MAIPSSESLLASPQIGGIREGASGRRKFGYERILGTGIDFPDTGFGWENRWNRSIL